MWQFANKELLYSIGHNYEGVWGSYIVFGALGLFLNSMTLVLFSHIIPSRRPKSFHLIRALICSDLIFSTSVLIFNSLNWHYQTILNDIECEAQTLFLEFFFIMSGCTHAVIAVLMRLNVCDGMEYAIPTIIVFLSIGASYAAACALLSIYLPHTGYSPLPSGTWCLTQIFNPLSFVALMGLGCGVPPVVMGMNYYQIYINVMEGREILKLQGIQNAEAKSGVINEIKQLFVFVFAFYFACVPFMAVPLYYWISGGRLPPPLVDAITAPPAIFLICIVDPCLLIRFHEPVRDELQLWLDWLRSCLCCTFDLACYNHAPIAPADSNIVECRKTDDLNFMDWKVWLSRKDLTEVFKEWSTANFVAENVMFAIESREYAVKASAGFLEYLQHTSPFAPDSLTEDVLYSVKTELAPVAASSSAAAAAARLAGESSKVSELQPVQLIDPSIQRMRDSWLALRGLVEHIYEVYVRSPSAPLEINIPYNCRQEISETLGINSHDQHKHHNSSHHQQLHQHQHHHHHAGEVHSNSASGKSSHSWASHTIHSLKLSSKMGSIKSRFSNKSTASRCLPMVRDWDVLMDMYNNPDTRDIAVEHVTKIIAVFADAQDIIDKVIVSDVFPRFIKSNQFAAAVKAHSSFNTNRNSSSCAV